MEDVREIPRAIYTLEVTLIFFFFFLCHLVSENSRTNSIERVENVIPRIF
jgi:hypothetical protein